MTFVRLRDKLREERCAGKQQSLQQLQERFSGESVRRVLSRFKTHTSTGVCNLPLRRLKIAPPPVLSTLGRTLAMVAWLAVGPDECCWQLLDLVPKKLGGFRTVATMGSLWRILLGLLSPELRSWDDETALPGDSARAGCSAAERISNSHFAKQYTERLARTRLFCFGIRRTSTRQLNLTR